jgi:glycosyltransferase involved in cell wall biosynthesis
MDSARRLSCVPVVDQLAMEMNVVLSYGDLSHTSGYQTRILGELEFLDRSDDRDNTLIVFDRDPELFTATFSSQVPYQVHPRSAMLRFYPEMARLSRRARIRAVHAHNLYSAALALSAKPLYRYKVILDYHGRIPEEYVYLGKGGEPSRKALEGLERWTVTNADHVVVVSDKLRDYVCERYSLPTAKVSVIPCCADGNAFNWNTERRRAQRTSLGLDDKFICTHLGSFFEWYEPELLVHLFEQIRASIPNAHLLVVTGTIANVVEFLQQRLPQTTFTVMSAQHDQVPALLNASDIGFLLLRSSPNIRTSSPAKFSEYLNCGLPVLITSDVGDFSDLVATRGAGQVVQSASKVNSELFSMIQHERSEMAKTCLKAGEHLTWQAQTVTWKEIQRLL